MCLSVWVHLCVRILKNITCTETKRFHTAEADMVQPVITLINLDQLFICSCFFQLLFILKHDSSSVQLCSEILFCIIIYLFMVRMCPMTH